MLQSTALGQIGRSLIPYLGVGTISLKGVLLVQYLFGDGEMSGSRPELVTAFVNAVKEFGVY